MSICSKNKNYIIFKEERNMKLRRLMAIGMTVALTATMFSGVSVYAENSDPEPFKIGFPWDTANTDPTWISI